MSGSGQRGSRTDDDATVAEGGPATRATDVSEPGTVLGRYVVVEVLGEGGMGRVLRAYDPKLKREVALKLLRFEGDASSRARIIAEAQSMARLSHPNVLPVYDYDFEGGRPFIAMEYVEGRTLREWLEDDEPSRAEIVEAFCEAGSGLAAAHVAGLVHCDFKPANVLRGVDGRIRVMDFGLASVVLLEPTPSLDGILDAGSGETPRATCVMGTPSYMAPEQHTGAAVDARSDQYAFAVSLWEALHGQRPFRGATLEQIAAAKLQVRLETSDRRSSVPGSLRHVLLRGLSPDPSDRFPSMDAMLSELRRDPRRPRRIAAVLGIAVVGVGGLQAWSLHREDARQAACRERGDEIHAVWGPDAAHAVEAEFQAATPAFGSDTFARMSPWLDRYAEQWALLRTDLCLREDQGTGDQRAEDERLRAAAASCLDERRASLEALVELLHEPDVEVVAMAVPSAAGLSPLEPCGDATFLAAVPSQPADEATRDALAELRRSLAEVDVLGQAGRYEAAGARIEAVVGEAEALAHEPLVAEAHLLAARVARWRGRYPESRRYAEQAFDLAARAGFDDTTASAAAQLADLVGVSLAEHDVGLMWARFGTTVVERRSWEGRPIHGRLLSARGHILADRSEYEEATAAYDHALRIERDTLGDDHPRIADSLTDLGNVAEQSGDRDAAIEWHERALALRESALGAEHPKVAESLNNLGNAHWGRGELELAADYLRRAARIKAEAYGPEHFRVSSTLQNLGNVLYSQGRYDEAIAHWQQTLRIRDQALPAVHPDRASILANLAVGHLLVGDLDAALDHAKRALAVSEAVHGADHIALASTWRILAAVHQQRGEHAEAIRCGRRELAIALAEHGDSHQSVAEALRELGKLLLEAGDRAGALVELEHAAAVLRRANASAEAKALVDVQLIEALDPDHPDTTERTRTLATSAHAALCHGEQLPEFCAELGTMREGPSP